jgi:o-succinylbenzoate---CoA ligase
MIPLGTGTLKTCGMQHDQYNQLTINGTKFNRRSLITMANDKLSQSHLPAWEHDLFNAILSWLDDSEVVTLTSSGSTGTPKNFELQKAKMIQSALRTGQVLNLNAGDSALQALPVSFIAGYMMVVRSFVLNLDLIAVQTTSNPLNGIDRSFDFAAMTPMQVFGTLNAENGSDKIQSIEKLIIGGGSISRELQEQLAGFHNQIWATYGMTETLTHVALKRISRHESSAFFNALPGVRFQKDDRGCLIIYDEVTSNDGIITNDLVNLISETSFEFIGRFDHVINSGGLKISPELIENAIAPFMMNRRFVVSDTKDSRLGQKIVLVVEGEESDTLNALKLNEIPGLKRYEVPRQIIYLDSFPQTENGKIIREQVRMRIRRN